VEFRNFDEIFTLLTAYRESAEPKD